MENSLHYCNKPIGKLLLPIKIKILQKIIKLFVDAIYGCKMKFVTICMIATKNKSIFARLSYYAKSDFITLFIR